MSHKVTLIMPCYNAEPYIDVMIASVYGQLHDNIELICVDDGSTDSTRARLDEWKPLIENRGYSMIVTSKENGGTASAINVGLQFMSGDFVCFPDADDMLMPGYVSDMLSFLLENPNVKWVRCDAIVNDYTDNRFPALLSEVFPDERPVSTPYALELFLTQRVPISVCTIMVEVDYFKKCLPTKRLNESYMALQEYQLNLPLALHSSPTFIQKPLYFYIRREDGTHSTQTDGDYAKANAYYEKFLGIAKNVIGELDIPNTLAKRAKKWPHICDISLSMQRIHLATKHQEEHLRTELIQDHLKLIKPLLEHIDLTDDMVTEIDNVIAFYTGCALDRLIFSSDDLHSRIMKDDQDIHALLQSKTVCLYGAGAIGKTLLRGLICLGITPICVWDKNHALNGSHIYGVPISTPDFEGLTEDMKREAVVIMGMQKARYVREAEALLQNNGIENILMHRCVEHMLRAYIGIL